MSLSKSMNMFTETPFGENDGETRAASSPVDLDFGIGKLSVSPVQYESTCVEADESSKRMVESDVSVTGGLLSAFDSITFAEQPFLSNGLAKGTPQSDDIGYVCEANLHGRRANDCSMIHEPSSHSNAEADEVDEIEKPTKSNDHLIVYTSSRRNTSRNTYAKLDQNSDSKDQPTNCSVIAQNDSLSDLDSLQIARRKRSLISKRAKSSVWRLVPLPSSEQNNKLDPCLANVKKVERVRGGRGKKKAINDKKSVHKSSTPTGRISLKIRIGNQSCGVVNVAEKIVVSEKNIPSSCDIKENKYREELPGDMLLPNKNNSENVIASDASALGTSLDVTDSVKNKSTKLRCLDPETSPDSEVINSISDAQLCERGIQDMQDSPVMPTEKGVEECFADSIAGVSLGAETRHPCSTFKKACGDSEMNPSLQFSDATEPSMSQADKSVSNGQKKSLKCSRAKDLLPKKGKASRKKGDNSNLLVKPQISSQDNASGDLIRVESHLEAGNQTSPDPVEEVGYVSPHSAHPEFVPSSGQLNSQPVPPRNAWVLCDACEKWRRIAAALADKIDQTNCRWTCKDNADKNFADCSIPQEKSNSEINEELDISDASGDENAGDTLPKSNRNKSTADKPSSWTLIKTNLFLHRRRKTQNIDEVMVCSCKPPSDGRMGCGDECLNRILSIECIKGTCPCGELCSNQKFQKRIYAKLKWLRCGKKGYGLQALQDISQGQFIIEYVGEVLDVHAHAARQREYALQGHKHFYFMSLDRSEVIDACAKGNLGRFINHSCDPNCKTEKWTVNGEICIGLFAIRDIKKGEEVTFDYKYVRVTGAAAKKCVCGSPNCRGYIGDDPKSSDVIVAEDSDDEFAETEMICNDREMYDDRNHIMLQSSLEKENKRKDELEEEICRVKNLDASDTSIDKLGVKPPSNGCSKAATAARVVEMSIRDKYEPDNSDSSASASAALYAESETSSPLSPTKASFLSDEITLHNELKKSTTTMPGKLQPDGVKSKKKLKIGTMREKDEIDKPDSLSKARDSSPSIRKGKFKSNAVKEKGATDLDKSNAIRHKSKKLPGFPSDSHVESVEGKLNELLDSEGGISKRKDASRGYLKLLFLTAASGSNGHGEAIQSNRDLSMILDALLKTKSRTVLVDIINKNGLQMLHNIMKRYRKEFIKTPILRKLLKVLEYMAMREILTLEHIAGGPPRPGVESFKDSMLTLTEHADKQVHQIARNFRDRWIPKSLRKTSFTGSDNTNTLFRQHSTYGKSPASSLDHRSDRNGKNADSVESSDKQSPAASGVQTPTVDHSSASNSTNPTNTTRTRKRKSRWDIPMEECKQPKITTTADEGKANDHDAPPGFSSPCKNPSNVVSADPQERFVSNLPLSYGVPYSIAQQFGAREGEPPPNWTVAPGLPFYPFPPLPPYDKGEKEKPSSTGQDYSGSKRRMVCTSDPPEMNVSKGNEHSGFQPEGNLGRKYFRQQKWSHSKIVPPWLRMRNGWGANQFADS